MTARIAASVPAVPTGAFFEYFDDIDPEIWKIVVSVARCLSKLRVPCYVETLNFASCVL